MILVEGTGKGGVGERTGPEPKNQRRFRFLLKALGNGDRDDSASHCAPIRTRTNADGTSYQYTISAILGFT